MVTHKSHKDIYETVDFSFYVTRKGLVPLERFLVQQFLNKEAKTLEAGTGGGRIVLELADLGFSSLYAYDFVPGLIAEAAKKDPHKRVTFEVQDAPHLTYADQSFDQVLYLDQMISSVESPEDRLQVVREAYRVLRPGGTAAFTFLNYDFRARSIFFVPYLIWLKLLRWLRRDGRPLQYMPYLNLGGGINWSALLDRSPFTYWFRAWEANELLEKAGFQVVAALTEFQAQRGQYCTSVRELAEQGRRGKLAFVCCK